MYVRDTPVESPTDTPVESVQRFGRVSEAVTSDPRLRSQDTRVYDALALCERNGTVKAGRRLIAKTACTSQRRVQIALRRLESAGHIRIDRGKRGARDSYFLLSPIFAQSANYGMEAESPRQIEKPPHLLTCPKCSKRVLQILKIGWCRSCQWGVKVDGRAERVTLKVLESKGIA